MLTQAQLLSELRDHLLLAAHPVNGGTAFGVDWEPGSSVAPDASPWITAQACVAMCGAGAEGHLSQLLGAFEYLEHVRSEERGGWSYRPPTGCCITDVAAWVVLAQSMALQKHGASIDGHDKRGLVDRINRDLTCLVNREWNESGGFCPTPVCSSVNIRTYSTVMAIWGMTASLPFVQDDVAPRITRCLARAMEWLLRQYTKGCLGSGAPRVGFGWPPHPSGSRRNLKQLLGLNAQAVFVLTEVDRMSRDTDFIDHSVSRCLRETRQYDVACDELVRIADADLTLRSYSDFNATLETCESEILSLDGKRVECGTQQPMFFWAPWCAAALASVSRLASDVKKERAEEAAIQIVKCIPIPEHCALPQAVSKGEDYVGRHGTFELAEAIYCLSRVPAELAERWSVDEETPRAKTPATASGKSKQRDRLSPCHEKAYQQFEETVLLNTDLQEEGAPLRAVYDRLCESHHGPTKLPKSATWARYVRKALKHRSLRKNTPRTGRDLGTSIVPESKI